MGGIGDQINQYLFGSYLTKNKKMSLILDYSYYLSEPAFPIRINKFQIKNTKITKNIFKIKPKYISYLRFFNFKFLLKLISNFNVNHFNYEYWKKNKEFKNKSIKKNTYFFGYWHNIKYYEKSIIDNLQLKKKSKKLKDCISKITNHDVAIHVRGGDFLNDSHAVILSENYYLKSVKYFMNNLNDPKFYVFTNDIIYSKKILKNLNIKNLKFINKYRLKDYEEFEYLRNFSNYIISNSTFSWTASLISKKKKKICAPKMWYKNINIDKKRISKQTIIIK